MQKYPRIALWIFGILTIVCIGWITGFSSISSAKVERDTSTKVYPTSDGGYRQVPNTAFAVGERLTFDLSYGFVHAGEAIMAIPDYKYVNGRKTYETQVLANSYSSFDWIFKVRDRYATFMDIDGIFPWRFEQHVREGSYSHDYDAFFDPDAKTAETSDGNKYATEQYVHDIVSAFYYVRTLDLERMKKGDVIQLTNFYDGKTNPLPVRVLGHQRISVDAGTFDCIVIQPDVVKGGLFKSEGSITIWMTDDANHMPVRMASKILIGSIQANLVSYQGEHAPLTARAGD
jgi:hypothetical protein